MSLLEIKKKKKPNVTLGHFYNVIAPYDVITSMMSWPHPYDVIDALMSDWQLINTPWRHWKP